MDGLLDRYVAALRFLLTKIYSCFVVFERVAFVRNESFSHHFFHIVFVNPSHVKLLIAVSVLNLFIQSLTNANIKFYA